MKKTYKRLIIAAIVIADLILAMWAVCKLTYEPYYPTQDPLCGDFVMEDGRMAPGSSVDFSIAIGYRTVDGSDGERIIYVDSSKGCQVQCLAEDKIFDAEKDGDKILVYENGEQIGWFEYAPKKFLFHTGEEVFNAGWRGETFSLKKIEPASA